jgi:hypothetical protein
MTAQVPLQQQRSVGLYLSVAFIAMKVAGSNPDEVIEFFN